MKLMMKWLVLPALAVLAACGQGDGGGRAELVETNTGSIVMNDAQTNQALQSTNEQPANRGAATSAGSAGGGTGTP